MGHLSGSTWLLQADIACQRGHLLIKHSFQVGCLSHTLVWGLNIVFSLFKNHDTMYIKPWHPVYNAYMARLGHGMCHIEFLELLFKSILTEYLKMSLLMMYMQSILTIYIKMGTIKYMAWLEHKVCHIGLSNKVF